MNNNNNNNNETAVTAATPITDTNYLAVRKAKLAALTSADILAMTAETHELLTRVAIYGARQGRAIACDPVGISWTEDEDTAADAIQQLYSEAYQGREIRSVAGRVYWAGRNLGKRRAKDRIRVRGSVLVEEATDRVMPEQLTWTMRGRALVTLDDGTVEERDDVGIRCEVSSWDEVIERCHPARREDLAQAAALWSAGKDANRNAIRACRRALDVPATVRGKGLPKLETVAEKRRPITSAEVAKALASAHETDADKCARVLGALGLG
jgi:hypothetical protein